MTYNNKGIYMENPSLKSGSITVTTKYGWNTGKNDWTVEDAMMKDMPLTGKISGDELTVGGGVFHFTRVE